MCRGKVKKLRPSTSHGYEHVVLISDTGERLNKRVHVLVASAYVPNPDGLPFVNHIDGDKTNNKADNLEWVTHQGNMDHAKQTGLIRKGAKHPRCKLTDTQVLEIREKLLEGRPQNSLAREYGVYQGHISRIKRGAARSDLC